jgi:adenylate cyclase
MDYTTEVRRLSYKHPLFANILIQIGFWLTAYGLFFLILYFISLAMASLYTEFVEISIFENILVAAFSAIVLAICLGIIDYFIEPRFRRSSLGIELLVKSILYLIVWFSVSSLSFQIGFHLEARFLHAPGLEYSETFSNYMLIAAMIYTFFMIALVNYFRLMQRNFGPGKIIPLIFGWYRKPSNENRIFLFMDLRHSTSYAETLGHIKYSQMIQDCFKDANQTITSYNAEIYQYVGDEIVLTWISSDGLRDMNCIAFYFAFQERLEEKRDYYLESYGFLPMFKAGAHIGEITVAEVGELKRDIAYHGDTINTASRIQSACNSYSKSFLISEALNKNLEWNEQYISEYQDTAVLKGKTAAVGIFSVRMK